MASFIRRMQRMHPHKVRNSKGRLITVRGRVTKSTIGSKLGTKNPRAPKPHSEAQRERRARRALTGAGA